MSYTVKTTALKTYKKEFERILNQENAEAATNKSFPCREVISTNSTPETLCGDTKWTKTILCKDCHTLYKAVESGDTTRKESTSTEENKSLWTSFKNYVSSHPKLAIGLSVLGAAALLGGVTYACVNNGAINNDVKCSELNELEFGAQKNTMFYFEDIQKDYKKIIKLAQYMPKKNDSLVYLDVRELCKKPIDSNSILGESIMFSCNNENIIKFDPEDLVSQKNLNQKLKDTKCDPIIIKPDLFFKGSLAQGKTTLIELDNKRMCDAGNTENCELVEKSTAVPEKPVTEKPKPATERPKPATERPKPATERPKPATEKPKPATEKPKPATEKPKPVTEKPKPVTEKPKPVTEKPKPATEKPKPVTEKPYKTTGNIGLMGNEGYTLVLKSGIHNKAQTKVVYLNFIEACDNVPNYSACYVYSSYAWRNGHSYGWQTNELTLNPNLRGIVVMTSVETEKMYDISYENRSQFVIRKEQILAALNKQRKLFQSGKTTSKKCFIDLPCIGVNWSGKNWVAKDSDCGSKSSVYNYAVNYKRSSPRFKIA